MVRSNSRGGHKRSTDARSVVSVRKVTGISDAEVEKGLDLLLSDLGGTARILPPGAGSVLIKPNLMMGSGWDSGVTVHPLLIELLVERFRRAGCEVIVGEGAGWGCGSEDAFRKTGVEEICARQSVPLVDFKRGRDVTVPVTDGLALKEFTVDEIVPKCDFIVSLAKMKTHCETLVSLSLKNMKGLISRDSERLRFHLLDVNRCLVDVNRTFKPGLSIVEGIVALEGIGPLYPGKPKNLGVMVGGTDPVAVDAVCTRIMRTDPGDIRHIVLADEAGLGTMDVRRIDVTGERLESVIPPHYEKPPTSIEGLSPFESIRIVNGKPCSNCIASLASYLYGYIDRSKVDAAIGGVTILVGAKARPKGTGNEIAIGNCLKRYYGKLPYVPGCPPASDAYKELIERGLLHQVFTPSTVDKDCRIVELPET
jgi:uncharacterized protein (DUF362 family)